MIIGFFDNLKKGVSKAAEAVKGKPETSDERIARYERMRKEEHARAGYLKESARSARYSKQIGSSQISRGMDPFNSMFSMPSMPSYGGSQPKKKKRSMGRDPFEWSPMD